MKKMKKIYKWVDGFDGGEESKNFTTEEVAIEAMKEHCSQIRLTKSELEKLQKKHENFVLVNSYDEEDNIIEDCIDSITITEDTALIY